MVHILGATLEALQQTKARAESGVKLTRSCVDADQTERHHFHEGEASAYDDCIRLVEQAIITDVTSK